jgi:hypothetical protein
VFEPMSMQARRTIEGGPVRDTADGTRAGLY